MPKREKKPKLPKTPKEKDEAPIHGQQGDDGQDKDVSDWEEYFDDNHGEGPSNQFGNMRGRTKTKETLSYFFSGAVECEAIVLQFL